MTSTSPNHRIKHEYMTFLEEGKGQCEATVDAVAKSLSRFEAYTRRRDFKKFRREQAIGFKKHLLEQINARTGERLSKATVHSTLNVLRNFFRWLAGQPGYKKKVQYADADYFGLSLKDTAIAKSRREPRVPTPAEIRTALMAMPCRTDIELRNRAVMALAFLSGCRDDALASLRLKHVDLRENVVHHDSRDVRVKFSKSFPTYFFPVGDDIRQIVEDWLERLKGLGYGPEDPILPSTLTGLNSEGILAPIGLSRECWLTAGPIRAIFKDAFTAAGLPYFNPHSFRKTLVRLGMERCDDAESFKAWSQNLGHDEVLTTFNSYGTIPAQRQRELIRSAGDARPDDKLALELGRSDMSVSTVTRHASTDEIAAEMDRRGSVIEALEERMANAQTMLQQAMRLLSRCHSRIHCLPRTSDTELAAEIDRMIGAIRRGAEL